jgi:hypothetical protein
VSDEQARRDLALAGVPQEHHDELAALAPQFERRGAWPVLLELLRLFPGRAAALAVVGRYLVEHARR